MAPKTPTSAPRVISQTVVTPGTPFTQSPVQPVAVGRSTRWLASDTGILASDVGVWQANGVKLVKGWY